MVGHYWLRDARARARRRDLRKEIDETLASIKTFAGRRARGHDHAAEGASASSNVLVIGIGGSRSGPQFVADALGSPSRDTHEAASSSTTPTPTASTASSSSSAAGLERDAHRRHLQVGRHQGDAQRHAGGRRPLTTRAGLDVRQARGRRHRRRQRARPATPSQHKLAGALPDVGLGRRPHLASCPRSACCRRRCRASTSTACSPAPRAMDAGDARAATPSKNPAALLAAHVVPRRRRARRQGHGDPALQGSARAVQPVPPAARDGVARQGEGPRRQRSSTRASPSTATRARPTSTPTCSSCATA